MVWSPGEYAPIKDKASVAEADTLIAYLRVQDVVE
jgi:hypothetical protein